MQLNSILLLVLLIVASLLHGIRCSSIPRIQRALSMKEKTRKIPSGTSLCLEKQCRRRQSHLSIIGLDRSSEKTKETINKFIGTAMASGAVVIYTPVLYNVLKRKDWESYSTTTWRLHFFSFVLSIIYPIKKGIPLINYLELIFGTIQSFAIYGLLSSYSGKIRNFLKDVVLSMAITLTLLVQRLIPLDSLGSLQIISSFLSNSALIPQMLVTFQTKKPSWSAFTSFLSLIGSCLRMLTTYFSSRDVFFLLSYLLGALVNLTLLLQTVIYR